MEVDVAPEKVRPPLLNEDTRVAGGFIDPVVFNGELVPVGAMAVETLAFDGGGITPDPPVELAVDTLPVTVCNEVGRREDSPVE